jgi:hypothetical protein
VKYRLLVKDEIIEVGDEYLNDDCETWSKVQAKGAPLYLCWMVGQHFSGSVFMPFRREVIGG